MTAKQAWLMWFLSAIFYAFQYILRVVPSVMINEIQQKFSIDAAAYGQFSGIYYIGYALLHLPIGFMLDKYGPRKILSLAVIMTVIGMLPLIIPSSFTMLLIGRLLVGAGSSVAILGVFKVTRVGFGEEKFSSMVSLAVMVGLIGAIYGGGPVNYMKVAFGFELVVKSLVIVGLVLAAIFYVLIPNIEVKSEEVSLFESLKEVVTNYKLITICILAGLMVGPLEGFADVWGTEFLRVVYKYSDGYSASLPSLIFIGMCFGAPVLSSFAEKTKNHTTVIAFSAFAMGVIYTIMIMFKISMNLVSICFILIGLFSSYQILAIYKNTTLVSHNASSLAAAATNMIIMIFGYFFHSCIGGVVKIKNDGEAISEYSLKYGVSLIPLCMLISFIGFLALAMMERKKVKSNEKSVLV